MKRKDWYTMLGAAIFIVVVTFANMSMAHAHDGPEMAEYFQALQAKHQLVQKKDKPKEEKPKPKPVRGYSMVASL